MLAVSSIEKTFIPMRATNSRASRLIVRAGAREEAKGLKGKVEDVLDNKVGPAARRAVTTTTQRSVEETRPEAQPTTLGKIMAFSSPIPERANSRLAMLGFLAAIASEFNTRVGVWDQVKAAPGPVALTFLTIIVATIIPSLRGVSPEEADRWQRPLRDTFTEKAEIYNGRLAMISFAAIIAVEAIIGAPFLNAFH
jgi:hypothetical protein